MKKLSHFAIGATAALTLTSCDSPDDASSDADASSVEMSAIGALEGVSDEPVADENASLDAVNSAADEVGDSGDPEEDSDATE